jgi:glycerol-3-phosphate acyltransferase PlsX
VSAGNTGAVAAASALLLGRLEGVQRPGIAAAMKVFDHQVVAIDVGANVDCRPTHLLQYAIMASVFSREVLKVNEPRVGLLNVGEESAKGNDLVKKAFELLNGADILFVGNIEPDDICEDRCDIVVCDGFVGNVMLKLGESLTMKLIRWLRQEVRGSLRYKLGFALCKDLFSHLKECADYTEYGGAPLLGVNGVTIITHGTSDANAIRNAIREARMFVEHHVNDHMETAIQDDIAARGLEA